MLTPYRPNPEALRELQAAAVSADQLIGTEPPDEGVNWNRYISAVRRYKWLMLLIIFVGASLGVAITRLVAPEYEVGATIFIASQASQNDRGPIRAGSLLQAAAWVELLRSFRIIDPVVRRLTLYCIPQQASDSSLFREIGLKPQFRPGPYTLELDSSKARYTLLSEKAVIETGALGDSIGRRVGLLWSPTIAQLGNRHKVSFQIITPREASIALSQRLVTILPEESNFLRLRLRGAESQLTANTLNEWIREYMTVAAEMKRSKLTELTSILGVQLAYADSVLKKNENSLEALRVHTITLPSEGSPLAAGMEATRDPVMTNYFKERIDFENTHRDRESLEHLIRSARNPSFESLAYYSLPGVLTEAPQLRAALEEEQQKQAELRSATRAYTEEHRTVRELRAAIEILRTQTIPLAASTALENLKRRESDLASRIQSTSTELRQIPSRTIEEMGLRREVQVADNLYRSLQQRYAEARLAEASATPDISVLDPAVAPQYPEKSKTWRLAAMMVMASIGFAFGLAVLLDHIDRRFRYPEQATDELRLPIVGSIPALARRRRAADAAADAQVVESFRALRLQLQHMSAQMPIVLTVSSPGPGDGKSLLSANLALSFADAGYRTLLIDGDIRRGMQHIVFGATVQPGLLNVLSGQAPLEKILQGTSHEKLTFVSRGTRVPGGPELLASWGMADLMSVLKTRFDAIIVDSPPLGAGIDPLALSVHTGNLLLVLRVGETDRKLALAKLESVGRLPIRVLGAVLNEVREEGAYRYYAYGYGTPSAASIGSLSVGSAEVRGSSGGV
jgi:polysaccharide biosynthesis transport protein